MADYLARKLESKKEDGILLSLAQKIENLFRNFFERLMQFITTNKYSNILMFGAILAITVFIYIAGLIKQTKDIQETGYLLYGIPIVVAVFAYGRAAMGLRLVFLTMPLWLLGAANRIQSKYIEGDISEIIIETLVLPFVYLIGCVIVGKLIRSERDILNGYKNMAAQLTVQNRFLQRYHNDLVKALTKAIDAKDTYTRGHSERVGCFALQVARAMGLSAEEQRDIFYAGTLHDIGKIGIKEKILCKPGTLTESEYTEIQNHSAIGLEILEDFESMDNVKKLIYSHHERWDGSGYPLGISGEAIPKGSRIIAVVDSYDALVTDRTYQKVASTEEALAELERCAGKLFDAEAVKVFAEIIRAGNSCCDFTECLNYINSL